MFVTHHMRYTRARVHVYNFQLHLGVDNSLKDSSIKW